jgi:hypothetical protein
MDLDPRRPITREEILDILRAKRERAGRKAPSLATMERWAESGRAKATDGCTVEPDGVCPHGCKSWLIVLGFC